jgi:hypothetical protein
MDLFIAILVALPILLICLGFGKSVEVMTDRLINHSDSQKDH